jgi:mRNA-degrading endonuclease RelE of RelBE toxin-antitoxin system
MYEPIVSRSVIKEIKKFGKPVSLRIKRKLKKLQRILFKEPGKASIL